MKNQFQILFILVAILFSQCKKKEVVIPNNQAKTYDNVSTVKIENYINRIYIDLLGREPLDVENSRELSLLREGNLSFDTRRKIITRLMTDTTYVVGDSSYKRAYYQRIYDLSKARLLEGASEADIQQDLGPAYFSIKSARLTGDSIAVFAAQSKIDKLEAVLKSRRAYQMGLITINQMYAAMLNNSIYDKINMNSLNFVNASFDDLFFRFPTRDEFAIAYDIIENNKGNSLFGKFINNKFDYCQTLTESKEFHEGMIKWCYLTLIGREPTTQETYNLIKDFANTHNLQNVQTSILITDEYAQF